MKILITLVGLLLSLQTSAEKPAILKASSMSPSEIQTWFLKGGGNTVLEFQKDDQIPLRLNVSGDFLESQENPVVYLKVKTSFFIKMRNGKTLLSLDGEEFKPFKKLNKGASV